MMASLSRNIMQTIYSLMLPTSHCIILNSKLMERLDRIYCCGKCKSVFLFKADVDDHKEMSGHADMSVLPFS